MKSGFFVVVFLVLLVSWCFP